MLQNAYIRDKGNEFEPIYVPGEIYSFYLNFDKPITDVNFANFRLHLMSGDVVASPNIGELKQYMVSTYSYNIYSQFVFPQVAQGCYHFAIVDIVTNKVKCRSNCICVEPVDYINNSALFQYRNKRPIANFNYDNIPEFYNIFRLPLNKVEYQYDVEQKQYRNASDKKLRNLYSYLDKFVKIESYYFDEEAHDAIAIAYQHNDILINGTRYTVKDNYQVDGDELQSTSKGSVNAYEQEHVYTPALIAANIPVLSTDVEQPTGVNYVITI